MALCYGCPRTRRQQLGQQRSTGRGSKCPVWPAGVGPGSTVATRGSQAMEGKPQEVFQQHRFICRRCCSHVPSARTFSPRLYLGSNPPPLGRRGPKALSFLRRFLLPASLRLVLLLPSYGGRHLGKVPQLPASPDTRTPICSPALLLPTCWPPPRFLLPGSDTAPAPGRKDPDMPSMLPPSLPQHREQDAQTMMFLYFSKPF